MTEMFNKKEMEQELNRIREKQKKLLLGIGNLFNRIGKDHVRWLMALNTGS